MTKTDAETETNRKTSNQRQSRPFAKLMLFVAATVLFLGVLVFQHPTAYGFIPRCPFRQATGLYCPGCGSMRATHYLLKGNVVTCLRYNPLVLLLLPLIVFLFAQWFLEIFKQKELRLPYRLTIYWGVTFLFLFFFVARNVPISIFEVLRPPEHQHDVIKNVNEPFSDKGHL